MTEKLTPAAEAFRESLLTEKRNAHARWAGMSFAADWVINLAARLFDAREREHQEEVDRLKQAYEPRCPHCRHRKATHGRCCTCQRCGLDHDSCHCDLDDVSDENVALKQEIERLKSEHAADVEKAERDIAYLYRVARMRTEQVNEAESRLSQAMEALRKIEAWELPPSGRYHCSAGAEHHSGCDMRCGQQSFEYCFGSNGARDWIRGIARVALLAPPAEEPKPEPSAVVAEVFAWVASLPCTCTDEQDCMRCDVSSFLDGRLDWTRWSTEKPAKETER